MFAQSRTIYQTQTIEIKWPVCIFKRIRSSGNSRHPQVNKSPPKISMELYRHDIANMPKMHPTKFPALRYCWFFPCLPQWMFLLQSLVGVRSYPQRLGVSGGGFQNWSLFVQNGWRLECQGQIGRLWMIVIGCVMEDWSNFDIRLDWTHYI